MDSFDSSRAWTSVASLVFIRITPTRVRKHTCNQVFNAARVCAAPSVIIARFRGGKNDSCLTGSKGLVFRRLFVSLGLNEYACVNMLWTFCCCVEIFFFYLEKRREDCLGYDYYLGLMIEVILFYDN